ncbi:MAG: class B sortase [Anaerococcus sp.]|nr:class B sortase [Anaerococcus sp.]
MEETNTFTKALNKILDTLVGIFVILLILYSSYSLYTSFRLFSSGVASSDLLALKPDPEVKELKESFSDLRKINEDVIGWISVDNTNIDHPILKGEDNMEYVNKDVYGNFAYEGSIFLDARSSSDFKDPYSLIYGHHMEHGAMFGDLDKFKDKNFFDQNQKAYLISEDKKYDLKLFALSQSDGYDQYIFNPTSITNYQDQKKFIDYIKEKSINFRDIDLGENQRIIALSTCQSDNISARLILFGVIDVE